MIISNLERGQIEQIIFLVCLNDLCFLYKHAINALDSYNIATDFGRIIKHLG